jgi:hypothetical protein
LQQEGSIDKGFIDYHAAPVIEPSPFVEIPDRGFQMIPHHFEIFVRGFGIGMYDAFYGIVNRAVMFIDPPA